jgi:hypothetical protein
MLLVDGYLVLVDQTGGVTQLDPVGVDLEHGFAPPLFAFDFAGSPSGYAQG